MRHHDRPDPEVPRDWVRPGFRWAVAVDRELKARVFLAVEEMTGFDRASRAEKAMLLALRRTAILQHLVVIEVKTRMARLGYATWIDLAESAEPTRHGAPRRSTIPLSTLRNIASGQRFIKLSQVAELETALGGSLLMVVTDAQRHDGSTDDGRSQAVQA